MHIEAPTTPAREPGTERRLPEPEQINWSELSNILRQAEMALEQLKAAHEVYVTTNREENWRTATPEQKQASDHALEAEQKAYEAYTIAATRRNEAMTKMDRYLQVAHRTYRESSDLEQMLLEQRQRLEKQTINPDGTVAFEIMQQISELDKRLIQVEAVGDAANDRLEKVLDVYHATLTGSMDEAMAAK